MAERPESAGTYVIHSGLTAGTYGRFLVMGRGLGWLVGGGPWGR
jgi:hypothetical protein